MSETKRSVPFHRLKRAGRLSLSVAMASNEEDTLLVVPESDASTINEITQKTEVLMAVSMVAVGHLAETEVLVKIEVSIRIGVLVERENLTENESSAIESSAAKESSAATESSEAEIEALGKRKRLQRTTSIACSSARARVALGEDRPAVAIVQSDHLARRIMGVQTSKRDASQGTRFFKIDCLDRFT